MTKVRITVEIPLHEKSLCRLPVPLDELRFRICADPTDDGIGLIRQWFDEIDSCSEGQLEILNQSEAKIVNTKFIVEGK
jgi:hypothetical protein